MCTLPKNKASASFRDRGFAQGLTARYSYLACDRTFTKRAQSTFASLATAAALCFCGIGLFVGVFAVVVEMVIYHWLQRFIVPQVMPPVASDDEHRVDFSENC